MVIWKYIKNSNTTGNVTLLPTFGYINDNCFQTFLLVHAVIYMTDQTLI